jgi:hypothetical protein
MLRRLVDSICDRPGETAMSRAALEDEVANGVLAFAPRDAVEFMLAGMIVSNYQLILVATHEAFVGDATVPRGKGNPGVVALERAVTGLLKELRIAQARPLPDLAQVSEPGVKAQPAGGATTKSEAKAATAPAPVASPPRRDVPPPSRSEPEEEPATPAPIFDQTFIDTMNQCTEALGLGGNRQAPTQPASGRNPAAAPGSLGRLPAGAELEPVD